MSFFQNTCKPKGFGGRIMLNMMNFGHTSLAKWGFTHVNLSSDFKSLDIGCGGGKNVNFLLKNCPKGQVTGVDYSEISVAKTKKYNSKYKERLKVLEANVLNLPLPDKEFDLVTAFETIYFWRDIEKAFKEVSRVLKNDGKFLICNESNGKSKQDDKWVEIIDNMVIYKEEEIKKALTDAGFTDIKSFEKDNWVSYVAIKK